MASLIYPKHSMCRKEIGRFPERRGAGGEPASLIVRSLEFKWSLNNLVQHRGIVKAIIRAAQLHKYYKIQCRSLIPSNQFVGNPIRSKRNS